MEKDLIFWLLKNEIEIIVSQKHTTEVKDNKIFIAFKSEKSALKGYDTLRCRYNNSTMWELKWSVKRNGLTVIIEYK